MLVVADEFVLPQMVHKGILNTHFNQFTSNTCKCKILPFYNNVSLHVVIKQKYFKCKY